MGARLCSAGPWDGEPNVPFCHVGIASRPLGYGWISRKHEWNDWEIARTGVDPVLTDI